jgi:hypothetical protein
MSNRQHLADKLYYDVICSNLQQTTGQPPILSFIETRTIPFVYSPEDYYLSIIRFTLDTNPLPIFVPLIQPNQPDKDLTVYSITLEFTSTVTNITYTQQTYIKYSPQTKFAVPPQPPSQTDNGLQNNSTGYYYIYNYQYWIYLINQAFIQCFNDLVKLVIDGGESGSIIPTSNPPVMAYDTNSNLAILYADKNGYSTSTDSNNVGSQIGIYFNSNMYNLFGSFPCYLLNLNENNQGKNVQIQTNTFGGSNIQPYPPSSVSANQYDAIVVYQEYSTIDLWNPVMAVVFCSNTLPIVPNQISSPLVYVNGLSYNVGGNNANVANIITDLVAAPTYKPTVIYSPSAQYRLIEMTGTRAIYTLDITCYWKNRIGELNPIRLSAGSTATIKFLFTKKSTENTK